MNPTDHEPQSEVDPAAAPQGEATSADSDPQTSDQASFDVYHEEAATELPEETRDEEMERLRREVDLADRRVLQAQAEAENFRKRMRRDYETQAKFAAMPFVEDFLQVRDNLIRAVDAAGASGEDASSTGLTEGVTMVIKQFDDVLAKHGVTEIPAAGQPFDPNVHEAISQLPSGDHPPGHVMHVATSGWQLHERVIRPAQVVVSAAADA